MLFSSDQLKNNIIEPSLSHIGLNSPNTVLILISLMVANNRQDDDVMYGPFSMSQQQHWDLWDTYLVNDPALASKTRGLASQHRFLENPDSELNLNWGYSVAIAALWLCKHSQKPLITLKSDEIIQTWFLTDVTNEAINYSHFMETYHRLIKKSRQKAA